MFAMIYLAGFLVLAFMLYCFWKATGEVEGLSAGARVAMVGALPLAIVLIALR